MDLVDKPSGLIQCNKGDLFFPPQIHPVCVQRKNNLIARYYTTEYRYHTQAA